MVRKALIYLLLCFLLNLSLIGFGNCQFVSDDEDDEIDNGSTLTTDSTLTPTDDGSSTDYFTPTTEPVGVFTTDGTPVTVSTDYNHADCGKQFIVGDIPNIMRISGGNVSLVGSWPWQVGGDVHTQVVTDNGKRPFGGSRRNKPKFNAASFCGGTIINARTVLTAAHCFDEDESMKYFVRVGDNDRNVKEYQEEIIAVKKKIVHAGFSDKTANHDIAVLHLEKELTLKEKVNAACLPDQDVQINSCMVTGWGDLEEGGDDSPILREARVPIVDRKKCSAAYIEEYGEKIITDNMLCAGYTEGGVDSCQGDSGGPLVCKNDKERYVLRGVISFGAGCARPNRFGVYTHVHKYMKWIRRHMA